MERVIFLDRDGTINKEVNYLHRPEDFEFIPGAVEGIKLLNDHGYKVVVVTNQAGVARGYYPEEAVQSLHEYINRVLSDFGAHVDAFYYCPHHPVHGIGKYKTECQCRKPEIHMLEEAGKRFSIDKSKSYMIGDNAGDILAGKKYGVTTILVGTGYGKGIRQKMHGTYDYYCEDLRQAVKFIVEREDIS